MALRISSAIKEKLLIKHRVCTKEVIECFENRSRNYLIDTREGHRTEPPTMWFISETNRGRLLKVVFIFKHGDIHIKTAYQPNQKEISIFTLKS